MYSSKFLVAAALIIINVVVFTSLILSNRSRADTSEIAVVSPSDTAPEIRIQVRLAHAAMSRAIIRNVCLNGREFAVIITNGNANLVQIMTANSDMTGTVPLVCKDTEFRHEF